MRYRMSAADSMALVKFGKTISENFEFDTFEFSFFGVSTKGKSDSKVYFRSRLGTLLCRVGYKIKTATPRSWF